MKKTEAPDIDLLRITDEIEQLVENGNGWMGKRLVKEAEYLSYMAPLRAATAGATNANTLLRLIEGLEQIVLNSKKTWWGKRVVDEVEFFTQIQRLRSAYTKG